MVLDKANMFGHITFLLILAQRIAILVIQAIDVKSFGGAKALCFLLISWT